MRKYYEVTGETRRRILEILDQRQKAHEQCLELAQRLGAAGYMHGGLLSDKVVGFKFEDPAIPDPKVLRRRYDRASRTYEDWYVPNRSTSEGKKLAAEMDRLILPGSGDIADAVRLDVFQGFRVVLPGVRVWGQRKRVILLARGDQRPKSRDCKRLADTAFEKLQEKYGDTDADEDAEA